MTEDKNRGDMIDESTKMFKDFFWDTEYKNKILALADFAENPHCALIVDYNDLEEYFELSSLAPRLDELCPPTHILDELFDYPTQILQAMEMAIDELLHPDQKAKVSIHPRLINLPKERERSVSEIKQNDIGTLIRTTGRIKSIREIVPKMVTGVFECLRCNAIIKETQPTDNLLKREPLECHKAQGGCIRTGASTKFILLSESSKYRDLQIVRIEEIYNSENPHQPQIKRVFLWDDLVGMNPINDVVINGIVKALQDKNSAIPELYIEAVSIEFPEDYYTAISLSEEDRKELTELMHRPDIYDLYVDSTAPGVKGYRNIKLSGIICLFGGVDKVVGTKTYRGKISILIIGDPSIGKSEIMQHLQKLAPKAVYGSGEGATGAGLTFACVQDKITKEWVIEMGLLVMGDNGVVIIDEIDKLDKVDTKRLHTAMESGIMPYSKAGLVGTLHADCTIIAGGNPEFGRFNSDKELIDQIKIDYPLLSRFDLIFGIEDTYRDSDSDLPDEKICDYILSIHQRYKDKNFLLTEPPLSPEQIKKMILLGKEIEPKLTSEASKTIHEYFIDLRKEQSEKCAPITWRQLHGLVRMTEAWARARLSDTATVEDANNAIKLVNASLYSSVRGDFDLLTTGLKKGQRERLQLYQDFIKNTSPTFSDILELAKANDIAEDTCKTDIKKLWDMGMIMESNGVYKLI